MKNIQLNYSQLLFLYAYLRSIDLSLDRNKWTTWDELQDYFKNMIAPSQVAQYLINIFNLPKTDFKNFNFTPQKKSLLNRLRPIIFKTFPLKQDEIIYCCKLLFQFDEVLHSDIKKYHLGIERIRIDIAEYYSNILGRMILLNDLDKLMKIEHFWQSEKIDISKLEEFIPSDFG
ncbi:hypothetical protein LF887_01140 [Chryseobacterium sp. MEBOG06]|uniref:hypothetical protein n=1 Tax=Chryseobacterium sp. MEBOG06 TaxID=2879938 RepID=UPI001F43A236|nr:hypothetical protein [Chryseobacterium sp. MEBOG06]UKB84286.1 hypothetical protein LF887_01140 [Chryseobacterium sp. MEBOG06]